MSIISQKLHREGKKPSIFIKIFAALFYAGFCFFSTSHPVHAISNVSASGYLGQTSWTAYIKNSPDGSVNATGFGWTTSQVLDAVNHRLFVADSSNNRVLVFPLDGNNNIITNNEAATAVIGASDLTHAGPGGHTASTLSAFFNLAFDSDNQRLFVSDSIFNRILAFNVAPGFTNGEAAIFELGQPAGATAFTSITGGTTQSKLSRPDDIDYDPVNARLFVSDEYNNRVLAFSVPAGAGTEINGENALFELGQPAGASAFTSGYTGGANLHSATQSTFGGETTGAAYDPVNERLFVADYYSSRVLAFSVPAGAGTEINGENALFELGQPAGESAFTTYDGNTTQNTLSRVDDITYDAINNRLFVSDIQNNRVMAWNIPSNATSSFNGANAYNLIGQNSWTSNEAGQDQNLFTCPEASHSYDPVNNILFIHRNCSGYSILMLKMIDITTPSLPAGTAGTAYNQNISVASTQGSSRTYSVFSGSLPTGISLNSSTGAITGTPTVVGPNTFTIEARDNFTGTGYFFDRATYTVNVLSNDATLSNLTTSSGTLAPVFSSGTTSYTESVANGVTSVTVTPTASQGGNSTITVNINGTGASAVASGSASGSLSLNVGSNTIVVLVTAQDGSTQDTYTITVTRAASNIDTVSSSIYAVSALSGGVGTITNVSYGTSKAVFKAALAKGQADQIWNDGGIHDPVLTGDTLVVTAQDGTTMGTYTVTISAPTIASVASDATTGVALHLGQTINFTVTPTVPEAGLTILPITYNGRSLTAWTAHNGGTTYTATYTVTSGDPDQVAPLQLTGVTATDVNGTGAATDGTDITDTIDAVTPQVSSAVVVTGLTVNITFNEAMTAGPAANYTVSGTGIGTLAAHPTTAASVGGNAYLLTWAAGEMFNGGNITITVANATDLAGNAIDPAHNSATHAAGAIGVAPAAPVIIAPTSPTSDHNPTIIGTGEPGATVVLTSSADGVIVDTAVVDGGGGWSITSVIALSDATHSLTAVQTDVAGNPSIASIAATLQVYIARSRGGSGGGTITYLPTITVQTPGSGGNYTHGSVLGLGWSAANGAFTKYKVYYSIDNGTTWITIADNATSTALSWIVPDASTILGKIKIEGYDSNNTLLTLGLSVGNFTIVGTIAPPLALTPSTTNINPPRTDSNVTGAYSSESAFTNTPDINTDLGLIAVASPSCVSGSLIKGSFPAVYYCGADGKRYVFVNEQVYLSWYADFSTVKVISDAALASIPVGGNITYRPGARLVKIKTDPKVYVVARGGVLRWVMTEAAAVRLYGANWNKMIDDVPDSLFVNYTVGVPITE